jgi:hypothetical protein
MWVPYGIYPEKLCLTSGVWHAGKTVCRKPIHRLKKELAFALTKLYKVLFAKV